jgi:hypothetical protein
LAWIISAHDTEVTMPTQEITRWRSEAGEQNPAGPLFTGGEFAESEITLDSETKTGNWCSMASGSFKNGMFISCC